MSIGSVLITAGEIGAALLPTLVDALKGGTPASILTHAMLVAAEEVALRRMDATHDGARPHPLSVEALRLEDAATRLEALGQPISAVHVRGEAAELRRRAAALAPTDPAPASDR